MKQDKLEKFVVENREAFDIYEPPEGMWDKIHPTSTSVRKFSWKTYGLRIAATIAIFIAAWFTNDLFDRQQDNKTAQSETELTPEQKAQYQLLMEAEGFYTSRISLAKQQITLMVGNDKEIIKDVNTDLVELDKVFEDLKNDLKDNGANEEVIEAMIQNYRIKLNILEEMLLQLKSSGSANDKTNDYEI